MLTVGGCVLLLVCTASLCNKPSGKKCAKIHCYACTFIPQDLRSTSRGDQLISFGNMGYCRPFAETGHSSERQDRQHESIKSKVFV